MPKWVPNSYGLKFTPGAKIYTLVIFLVNSAKNQESNWKMARIFSMVYKLGVEILTSKIRYENGDKFKNGWSKKGVE
jgi:hypothetical protein